jgi:RHS repeat-associated protein
VTYPSGLVVRNCYTAKGYLLRVQPQDCDATSPFYWSALQTDAEGHLTLQAFGNGVQTVQAYDPSTGRLTGIQSDTTSDGTAVQYLSYGWDMLGNLTRRQDFNAIPGGLSETFGYDTLNRLTAVLFSNNKPPKFYVYDALGNITIKSDVGNGTYHYEQTACSSPVGSPAGPHAVTRIDGTINIDAANHVSDPTFCYDANGNLTWAGNGSHIWRTVAYASFNMPCAIVAGPGPAGCGDAATLAWAYDSEHARTKETRADGSAIVFLNPRIDSGIHVERWLTASSTLDHWENTIYAGGQAVAIQYDYGSNPVPPGLPCQVCYLHKDHLGSTQAITNASGVVIDPTQAVAPPPPPYVGFAYDPWGKRRHADGSDDTGDAITSITRHGFTGHEHLPEVGLIHMNGRIFDPLIGRFMTGDPVIASVLSSQAYNRYSYLANNPLNGTDPSGFCGFPFGCAAKFVSHLFNEAIKIHMTVGRSQIFQAALLIAGSAACGVAAPACAFAISAVETGINGGSLTDALKAGAITGATAWALQGASGISDPIVRFGVMAAIGCASAATSGGGGRACLGGGFSAGVGALGIGQSASGDLGFTGDARFIAGLAITAALGGATSLAGGGKFANGAITASFAYLASQGSWQSGGNTSDTATPNGTSGQFDPSKPINADDYLRLRDPNYESDANNLGRQNGQTDPNSSSTFTSSNAGNSQPGTLKITSIDPPPQLADLRNWRDWAKIIYCIVCWKTFPDSVRPMPIAPTPIPGSKDPTK